MGKLSDEIREYVVSDAEINEIVTDYAPDYATWADRIEELEVALRKIAKSGVGIHSGWGWIQVEAQKALGESE